MRSLTFVLGAALMAACAKPDAPPADPAPPAAPTVNLADVAGTWTLQTMREGSDSVIVTGSMVASADPAAWTMTLPGRPPMALRVSTSADSVITEAGPYESVLRPGVQVTTRTATRLEGGMMVGTTVATYSAGPDSVVVLRFRGTRNP